MKSVSILQLGKTGNTLNISRAFSYIGAIPRIITKADEVLSASRIVLPGVGSFSEAMYHIKNDNLYDAILEASKNKPILGICLGMQLFANIGYEFKVTKGLGLLDGEVIKVNSDFPTPNQGFRSLNILKNSILMDGIDNTCKFYFMHSYELVNYTDICSLSSHGRHKFVSSICRENIFGVQFHPEKSREAGHTILKNFINFK